MSRDDFPSWKSAREGRRFWASWRAHWAFHHPLILDADWDVCRFWEKP